MLSNADDLFIFRVGPKKQIFQVDKKMVAQASPVFDRMMNNGVKETQDGTADLPEVEPNTFLTFLNFAFHAAEAQQDTSEPAQYANSTPVVVGPLLVLMIDAGQKTSHCRSCCTKTELRFTKTFPFCEACLKAGSLPKSHLPYCTYGRCAEIKCDKLYACGMLCWECIKSLNLSCNSTQLLSPGVHQMQDDVEFFRFDVPMLAKEAASEMRQKTQTTCLKNPVEIIKIFAFSDLYNIPNLRKLALFEVFETLALRGSAESLADLITYIYGTTPDSEGEATLGSKHVLRRMISAYVAYHSDALQTSPEMARMLRSGGGFGVDLFMATSMIAKGKLGKGWKTD